MTAVAGTLVLFLALTSASHAQEFRIGISDDERAWLAAHPKIVLGSVPDWAPISMRNSSGDLSGMADSYKNLIELRIPIRFDLAPDAPWGKILDEVRDKKIDVVMPLGETKERDKYLLFTDVLAEIPQVIITRNDAKGIIGLEALSGKRVSVRNRFFSHEWMAANNPEIVLIPKETTLEALDAVLVGEVDAFIGSLAESGSTITKFGLVNLKVAANAGFVNSLRIGVRNDWPELLSILNKAIADISPQEHNGIWNLWIHFDKGGMDMRAVYAVVGGLLLIILVGSVLYVIRIHKTRFEIEKNEIKYRMLAQTANDAIISIDGRGRVIFWNGGAEKIFGYSGKEILGENISLIVPERYRKAHGEGIARVAGGGPQKIAGKTITIEALRKGGQEFPVELSLAVWEASGEKFSTAIIRDITERKRAEDALRLSETRLMEAQRIGKLGFLDWDLKTDEVECSEETLRMYGISPGKKILMSEEIAKLVHPDDSNRALTSLAVVMKGMGTHHVEHRIVRPDGKIVYVDTSAAVFKDGTGRPIRILGSTLDVTERKLAEDALRKSYEDFKEIMEHSSVAMGVADKNQRILLLNKKFIEVFGYDLSDLPTIDDWWPRAYPDASYREPVMKEWYSKVDEVINKGVGFVPMETNVVCKDGGRRDVVISMSVIGDRALTVFQDITKRKAMEDELRVSQSMLSNAQALAHFGNWEMDLTTGKGKWSDESYRIFGFEPGAFQPSWEKLLEMIHPDDVNSMNEYLRMVSEESQAQIEFDFRIIRPDGEERIIHDTLEVVTDKGGKPIKLTGVNYDVTERKLYERKLEAANQELRAAFEQMRHTQVILMRSEKLAAVGTLAAGVAHEILNPLNIISTICQLILLDERRGRLHDNLVEINRQVQRAAKITNSLRMFAREKKFDITPVDLHALFDNTLGLLENDLFLDNIIVNRKYDPDAPLIMADADQLAQVFLNLLTNARDALRPGRGGIITVETRAVANGVEFLFHDNGPGIPEELLDKIFDPFFTTKDPGSGTGLGLAIVHSIIENHGGNIKVESREREGVLITIFLPKDGESVFIDKKLVKPV
jgi:hypothetical protein